MKKFFTGIGFTVPLVSILTSCGSIGDKTMSMSVIYCATTVLSLIMLVGYCLFIKKKEAWFFLLFSSVFVVNIGYLSLAVSKTLEEALLANRIAYLGSVLLPLSMFMIILNATRLKYGKITPVVLFVISGIVFFIAASPGYLDIYYKSVELGNVDGVTVLIKEYGPWHPIYLFYLLGYFATMIAAIVHAMRKKKIESVAHAVILLSAVFVNIAVWLLEQLVSIEFEFLSVSYIISELFLICLYLMIQNQERLLDALQKQIASVNMPKTSSANRETADFVEHCKFLAEHLPTLTATERAIYDKYLDGKGTKEIMKELNIAENTLKYHNKNLYGKLGVSSRKQLVEYAKALMLAENED